MAKLLGTVLLSAMVALLGAAHGKSVPKNGTLKMTQVYIIDTPKLCPRGQKVDSSGNCKAVWKRSVDGEDKSAEPAPACIIDCGIPTQDCPPGQKPDANGECREEWGGLHTVQKRQAEVAPLCIIGCLPNRCPEGQRPDANGVCREPFLIQTMMRKLRKRETLQTPEPGVLVEETEDVSASDEAVGDVDLSEEDSTEDEALEAEAIRDLIKMKISKFMKLKKEFGPVVLDMLQEAIARDSART